LLAETLVAVSIVEVGIISFCNYSNKHGAGRPTKLARHPVMWDAIDHDHDR